MRILNIKKQNIIKEAIKLIKKGEIVISPTDTVYGLICDATNKKTVKRLFKIKKRPREKPIPIFVKDIEMAKKLAKINPKQEKFLKKVWPGKVTVVLKSKDKKTIGLRIPNYKFINQLLSIINKPLTGTSANISGKPASTRIKEVIRQFQNQKHQPDLIIDAGNLKPAKPSMVIDLTSSKIKILRK